MTTTNASRYWHYRTNDLSDSHFEHLKLVDCEWIYIGTIEVGELEKGEHYHAAIKFKRSYEESYVMKRVCSKSETKHNRNATWYLEPKYASSTLEQFIKYVFKGDAASRLRFGEYHQEVLPETSKHTIKSPDELFPKTKEAEKAEAKKALELKRQDRAAHGDIDWFRENDQRFLMSADFNRLLVWAQPDATHRLEKLENYFIYGDSGTGKSSSIDFLYPNCYRKIKDNEKWDSYYNLNPDHETVYFDEMDDIDEFELCMGGFAGIKAKADVYPFAVRQNFGNRQLMIRPKRIIITSNFTPSQIFGQENKYGKRPKHIEMMLRVFNRKFKVMHISEWQAMNGIYFDTKIMRTRWINEEPELESTSEMISLESELTERRKRVVKKAKRITI